METIIYIRKIITPFESSSFHIVTIIDCAFFTCNKQKPANCTRKKVALKVIPYILLRFKLQILLIGLGGSMFANGLGDLGSMPGRIIPKTLRMVLDTSLLYTQQYKVCIEGKVEQSRERSNALPYTSV